MRKKNKKMFSSQQRHDFVLKQHLIYSLKSSVTTNIIRPRRTDLQNLTDCVKLSLGQRPAGFR